MTIIIPWPIYCTHWDIRAVSLALQLVWK